MIDRTRIARHLEPWKQQIPSQLLHSMLLSAEEDPGVKQVLSIHRETWFRRADEDAVHTCQECRTSWPCPTAQALGVRW